MGCKHSEPVYNDPAGAVDDDEVKGDAEDDSEQALGLAAWQSVRETKADRSMTTDKQVNQYKILKARPLGVGATSAVYLATDVSKPGSKYALKVAKKSILRYHISGWQS